MATPPEPRALEVRVRWGDALLVVAQPEKRFVVGDETLAGPVDFALDAARLGRGRWELVRAAKGRATVRVPRGAALRVSGRSAPRLTPSPRDEAMDELALEGDEGATIDHAGLRFEVRRVVPEPAPSRRTGGAATTLLVGLVALGCALAALRHPGRPPAVLDAPLDPRNRYVSALIELRRLDPEPVQRSSPAPSHALRPESSIPEVTAPAIEAPAPSATPEATASAPRAAASTTSPISEATPTPQTPTRPPTGTTTPRPIAESAPRAPASPTPPLAAPEPPAPNAARARFAALAECHDRFRASGGTDTAALRDCLARGRARAASLPEAPTNEAPGGAAAGALDGTVIDVSIEIDHDSGGSSRFAGGRFVVPLD